METEQVGLAERVAAMLYRQDLMEARCRRIEDVLGLTAAPAAVAAPQQPVVMAFAPAPPMELAPVVPSVAVAPLAPPLAAATPPSAASKTLEAHIGLQWLNRIGVLTLLLGVAFAFKTAVDNNWIGPAGRIALGVVAALGTLAIGDLQWRRAHHVFAQGLTGLGMALLYLTGWAACTLYHLVPQPVAFALMVATTVASGALALRYASQAIAVLALLGGYLTPIALATGEPHGLIFLAYLALLNAAAIVLARRRVWPVLEAVAMIATAIAYLGWFAIARGEADLGIATAFAGVFYLQYALARSRAPWPVAQLAVPMIVEGLWPGSPAGLAMLLACAAAGLVIAERRRGAAAAWTALWLWAPVLFDAGVGGAPAALALTGGALGLAGTLAWIGWAHVRRRRPLAVWDLALVVATPVAAFAVASLVLEPDHHRWLGAIAALLAASYAGLARALRAAAVDRRAVACVLGVAFVGATAALPLELAGFPLAIGWTLEAVALLALAARQPRAELAAGAAYALAVIALAIATADAPEPLAFANLRFVAFAAVAGAAFAATRRLGAPARRTGAAVVGHLVALIALELETLTWIRAAVDGAAQASALTIASTLVIAGYAVLLIALGVVRRRARDRVLGLIALAAVVLKLYGNDVWALGRGFQVAAFLALGALLLAVSYVYSRYRDELGRLWRDRAPD